MKQVKTTRLTDLPTIQTPNSGKVFVQSNGSFGWVDMFDENGVMKLKADLDRCITTFNETIETYNKTIIDLQERINRLSEQADSAATATTMAATTTATTTAKSTKKKSSK